MYLYDIPGWWPRAHWLFELLQARKAGDINLKEVTICAPERHPTGSAESEHVPPEKNDASPSRQVTTLQSHASSPRAIRSQVFNWPLPARVARLARSARVELKILLERENPRFDDIDALDILQEVL
jgi:hypothetical protein